MLWAEDLDAFMEELEVRAACVVVYYELVCTALPQRVEREERTC